MSLKITDTIGGCSTTYEAPSIPEVLALRQFDAIEPTEQPRSPEEKSRLRDAIQRQLDAAQGKTALVV